MCAVATGCTLFMAVAAMMAACRSRTCALLMRPCGVAVQHRLRSLPEAVTAAKQVDHLLLHLSGGGCWGFEHESAGSIYVALIIGRLSMGLKYNFAGLLSEQFWAGCAQALLACLQLLLLLIIRWVFAAWNAGP